MSEEHTERADSWITTSGATPGGARLADLRVLLLHFLFGLIVFVATVVAVNRGDIGAIWAIRIFFH